MSGPTKECSKCGADITETYENADPDVGIFHAGWYCEECEIFYEDDWDDSDIPDGD